jgi:hypothetical protein
MALRQSIKQAYEHILDVPDELDLAFVEEVQVLYGNMIVLINDYINSDNSTADEEDIAMFEKINGIYNAMVASYIRS